VSQGLDLGTTETVTLGIIDELRCVVLGSHAPPFVATRSFGRVIALRPDELHFSGRHLYNVFPANVAPIGKHLFRLLVKVLLHPFHGRYRSEEHTSELQSR